MRLTGKFLKKPITATLIAVVLGLIVAGIVLATAGYNPFAALWALGRGVFSAPKYTFKVFEKSMPIILTGISVAFAFKTGLFNIGAEGQFIMGSIFATMVGIQLNLPPVLQVPVVLFAGVFAGAMMGGISGFLKAKFGIHEVLTGIMLNWIAFYLSNFFVDSKVFQEPNTGRTYPINESGYTMILYKWAHSRAGLAFLSQHKWLREILLKTDLNYGIIIAVAVAIIVWFVLYKTTKGYAIRAVGFNSYAAEFAGIGVKRNIAMAMVIAGGVSGLAAALVITGLSPHAVYKLSMFEGTGFNGLSVALIAGSSPIGCVLSGLLLGGLIYGGQTVQSDLGVPSEIINIMIGTIVFFVALTRVIPVLAERLERREKNKNDKF